MPIFRDETRGNLYCKIGYFDVYETTFLRCNIECLVVLASTQNAILHHKRLVFSHTKKALYLTVQITPFHRANMPLWQFVLLNITRFL